MRDCVATLRIDFTRSENGELQKNGQGDLLAQGRKGSGPAKDRSAGGKES